MVIEAGDAPRRRRPRRRPPRRPRPLRAPAREGQARVDRRRLRARPAPRRAQAADWDVATDARPKELLGIFPRAIPTGIEHGTVTVVKDGHALRGDDAPRRGRRTPTAAAPTRSSSSTTSPPTSPAATSPSTPSRSIRSTASSSTRSTASGTSHAACSAPSAIRASASPRTACASCAPRASSATLELTLDPDTEAAIAPTLDTFRKVSAERVRDEWVKTMKARAPVARLRGDARAPASSASRAPSCSRASAWSRTSGTRTTSGATAWRASTPAPADPILRIAALLHDVGKPRTRAWSDKTKDYTFYDHERVGAEIAEPIAARLRFSNDERAAHRRARAPPPLPLLGRVDRRGRAPLDPARRPGPRRGPLRPERRRRPRQGPRLRAGPRRARGARRRTSRRCSPRAPRSRRATWRSTGTTS